jgi:hypothetical protein
MILLVSSSSLSQRIERPKVLGLLASLQLCQFCRKVGKLPDLDSNQD